MHCEMMRYVLHKCRAPCGSFAAYWRRSPSQHYRLIHMLAGCSGVNVVIACAVMQSSNMKPSVVSDGVLRIATGNDWKKGEPG